MQPLHFRSFYSDQPAFSLFSSFSSVGVRVRTRPAYRLPSLRDILTRSRLVGASAKGIPGPPLLGGGKGWLQSSAGADFEDALFRFLTVCIIYPGSRCGSTLPFLSSFSSQTEVRPKRKNVPLSFSICPHSRSSLPRSLFSPLIPSVLAKSPSIAVVKKELSSPGARYGTRLLRSFLVSDVTRSAVQELARAHSQTLYKIWLNIRSGFY